MPKIIALEGIDGVGKTTQWNLTAKNLEAQGLKVKKIKIPSDWIYEIMPTKQLFALNAYQIATMFVVDRFLLFRKELADLENYDIILLDRSGVLSNFAYQGAKLDPAERAEYFIWLNDFETNKFAFPKPDLTIFFKMSPQDSVKLIESRGREISVFEEKMDYLKKVYQIYLEIAEKDERIRILECLKEDKLLTVDQIQSEIQKMIAELKT